MLFWFGLALGADLEALRSDEGWEPLSSGAIAVSTKSIGSVACVRATSVVDVPAEALLSVVIDADSTKDYVSDPMIASRVLLRNGAEIEFYEHLDVPGWTLAADRFWVLRGHVEAESFWWEQFDWRSAYPELAAELARDHANAVEPTPNYGEWSFVARSDGTLLRHASCSDAGGSLPRWLARAAATKTLPTTVEDVVREARRRLESP